MKLEVMAVRQGPLVRDAVRPETREPITTDSIKRHKASAKPGAAAGSPTHRDLRRHQMSSDNVTTSVQQARI